MSIGTMDIFLLVIIVASLVIGFFWGAVRSVMLLAAWLLAFLAGAYLQLELGSYLARQWTNFPTAFNEMAAFGIIYMGLLLAAPFIIMSLARSGQRVSSIQVLDDATGALFATFVSVLGIAGLLIVLSTFYGPSDALVADPGGPEWTSTLYQSLLDSNIGEGVNEHLVPLVETVLGPILPAGVRADFG